MPPTVTTGARGTRQTGSWVDNQRPQNPREGMFHLFPKGDVALTALLSKLKRKKPKDPVYSHFTKNLPEQGGLLNNDGIYTNAGLGTAYTAAVTAAGNTVYAKLSANLAGEFRVGHQVMLIDSDDYRQNTNASVSAVVHNADASYIACQIHSATTTTAAGGHELSTVDRILIIGSANVEGGTIPDPVNYSPVEITNQTQIFWTPYEVTRTQLQTELVTGDTKKEEMREKLELHGIEMEKTFFWGQFYTQTIGDKPKRFTMGIVPMIHSLASDRVYSYTHETASDYAGKNWETAGMKWIEAKFDEIAIYGPSHRHAWVGQGVISGLTALARANSTIKLETGQNKWGQRVTEWLTPSGLTVSMFTHPLFSINPAFRNTMVITPLENIEERPLQDTVKTVDKNLNDGGHGAVDGIKEGWLTETGLWYKFPYTFAVMYGVGLDNSQS